MSENPSNWKGPLYFNPKDPRIMLPKLNGSGWTLNFGNPYSHFILIGMIGIIVAASYLM